MNKTIKSIAIDVGVVGLLLGAGHVVGITLITGITVGRIAGELGNQLLPGVTDRTWQHCRERFVKEDGIFNHDLQRAMQRAFVKTAADIQELWWETPQGKHLGRSKEQRVKVEGMFKSLSSHAALVLTDERLGEFIKSPEAKTLFVSDETVTRERSNEYLAACLYGHDEGLAKFVLDKLPYALACRFAEELKIDARAWQSYQRLTLDSLGTTVHDIRERQELNLAESRAVRLILEEVAADLERLKEGQSSTALDVLLGTVIREEHERLIDEIARDGQLTREVITDTLDQTSQIIESAIRQVSADISHESVQTRDAVQDAVQDDGEKTRRLIIALWEQVSGGNTDVVPNTREIKVVTVGKIDVAADDLFPEPRSAISPDGQLFGLKLDIGTSWGLHRGRSVRLLVGASDSTLWRNLSRVERELQNSIGSGSPLAGIPARYWFGLTPDLDAGPPPSRTAIWEAVQESSAHNRCPHNLEQQIADETAMVGLVASFDYRSPGITDRLHEWCIALTRDLFHGLPLALVIHLQTPLPLEAVSLARQLRSRLSQVDLELNEPPSVLLSSKVGDEHLATTTESGSPSGGDASAPRRRFVNERPTGPAFHSWMSAALDNWDLIPEAEQSKYHGQLITWFDQLDEVYASESKPIPFSAQDVVLDLTAQFGTEASSAIDQMLIFTSRCLPAFVISLVEALSFQEDPELRRVALRFAADSDDLVDAWLSGFIHRSGVESLSTLDSVIEEGGYSQALALGLVRWSRHQGRTGALTEVLVSLRENLPSEDARSVIDLTLNGTDHEEFYEYAGLNAYALALRSGYREQDLIQRLASADLNLPQAWWLIATMPPTRELLRVLSSLPDCKRAVFGLCSAKERLQIESDPVLQLRISECRVASLAL